MSNIRDVRRKPVLVELQEETYELCYDLNAFAELEEQFGSVENALKTMEKGSFKAIRTFIWAGLIRNDETLTERQVGALIQPTDLEYLADKIAEALDGVSPKGKATAKTPAKGKKGPNQPAE